MVDLRVLPESAGRQTFPSGDPEADAETYASCRQQNYTDPARPIGHEGLKVATHELPVGFSESELARENGAAISAKTELRQLRANKCTGAWIRCSQ